MSVIFFISFSQRLKEKIEDETRVNMEIEAYLRTQTDVSTERSCLNFVTVKSKFTMNFSGKNKNNNKKNIIFCVNSEFPYLLWYDL